MDAKRIRADALLVQRGLFKSRSRAQAAIDAGLVTAQGAPVRKASEQLCVDAALRAAEATPWVSRGGVKLDYALDKFKLDPFGRDCLDIGASTGGFTHVLLARGAASVIAVDVGHGQLAAILRADARVRSIEKQDARTLTHAQAGAPSALTFDVSFISLRLVLPHVLSLAASAAWLVALVKPQFEVGRRALAKGQVKDRDDLARACEIVRACAEGLGWRSLGLEPSPVLGGDGAIEFLYAAERA